MTEFITRNYGNESFEVIIKTDSKEHYKATQDFARRLIDHAKPMTIQRWIPVTERLPEKSGKYLCIARSSLFRDATFQAILGYDKGGFHDGCICMDDVTHWMPLPEPPKGE